MFYYTKFSKGNANTDDLNQIPNENKLIFNFKNTND